MSLLNGRMRPLASTMARTQRRAVLNVRAQAAGNATVRFRIHRHVEYGQSLQVVGSIPELGAWDAKHAVELTWGDGDNWSATLTVPNGVSVEYKYITKRKEALDWCPGQNKGFTVPSAAAIEVSDSWDNHQSHITVLTPAAPPPEPVPVPVPAVEAPPAPAAIATPPPLPAAVQPPPASDSSPLAEALKKLPDLAQYTAVSTVENIHVAELEGQGDGTQGPLFASLAAAAAKHSEPSASAAAASAAAAAPAVFLAANNIVQGAPPGAFVVSQDPITQYEEADKYQEVVVGARDRVVTEATAAAKPVVRSVDTMTVAELRTELKKRGLSSLGSRRELIVRLQKVGALP